MAMYGAKLSSYGIFSMSKCLGEFMSLGIRVLGHNTFVYMYGKD